VLVLTSLENELYSVLYIYILRSTLCRVSRIFVSVTVTYYRMNATLVTPGITLRLFVRGAGCNNLDYNRELVCESCY
jgi:hypothetical protein